jgi:AraC family ethanolamine operon transcriptional activator
MSPARYLTLCPLNLARRALTVTDAAETTVTEIATVHGFCELGHFPVMYRSRFGKTSSTTLRRAPRWRTIIRHESMG